MKPQFKNPDGSRMVQITRDLPVEELNPLECKALLVHSDESNTPERHRALYAKWWNWFRSSAGRAWNAAEVAKRLAGAQ